MNQRDRFRIPKHLDPKYRTEKRLMDHLWLNKKQPEEQVKTEKIMANKYSGEDNRPTIEEDVPNEVRVRRHGRSRDVKWKTVEKTQVEFGESVRTREGVDAGSRIGIPRHRHPPAIMAQTRTLGKDERGNTIRTNLPVRTVGPQHTKGRPNPHDGSREPQVRKDTNRKRKDIKEKLSKRSSTRLDAPDS